MKTGALVNRETWVEGVARRMADLVFLCCPEDELDEVNAFFSSLEDDLDPEDMQAIYQLFLARLDWWESQMQEACDE